MTDKLPTAHLEFDDGSSGEELINEVVARISRAIVADQDAASLAFYDETCATCLYFRETTTGGIKGNICRYFVPTATAINQLGYPLHMLASEPACGQWKSNPVRSREDMNRMIEACRRGDA